MQRQQLLTRLPHPGAVHARLEDVRGPRRPLRARDSLLRGINRVRAVLLQVGTLLLQLELLVAPRHLQQLAMTRMSSLTRSPQVEVHPHLQQRLERPVVLRRLQQSFRMQMTVQVTQSARQLLPQRRRQLQQPVSRFSKMVPDRKFPRGLQTRPDGASFRRLEPLTFQGADRMSRRLLTPSTPIWAPTRPPSTHPLATRILLKSLSDVSSPKNL